MDKLCNIISFVKAPPTLLVVWFFGVFLIFLFLYEPEQLISVSKHLTLIQGYSSEL